MSNYYDLFCVTCGERGNAFSWNHGDAELAEIVKHLPVIAQLAPLRAALPVYAIELRISSWVQEGDLIDYAVKHAGHDVRPRSEYGELVPPL